MESWNKNIQVFGNYANSDEGMLTDASRPRDPYGFRLSNKAVNNILGAIAEGDKTRYFKVQRYLSISGGNTSFQDIPFKPGENQQPKDIGLESKQYGDIAELDSDGYIKILKGGLYQINVVAQYLKDGEWTSANIYSGPCGWYIRRAAEKDKRTNKPHMMVSQSSINFIEELKAQDTLVIQAGGSVNGTIWVSMTKIA